MKTQYTGIYRLLIQKHNSDIVHLYEHVIIQSFKHTLEQRGYSLALCGNLHGETFREVCFIEYMFFDENVERIFKDFMSNKSRMLDRYVQNELEVIEAESKSHLLIPSQDKLQKKLNEIDSLTWIDASSNKEIARHIATESDQIDHTILSDKRSKKSFRDIAILIGIIDCSVEEKLSFYGILPIIYNSLAKSIHELGMYELSTSPPRYDDDYNAMTGCIIFSMKRGNHTTASIQKHINSLAKDMDILNHQDELKTYVSNYAHSARTVSFPIDFYSYAGLVTSPSQVAEQMSAISVQRLLEKCVIKTVPATDYLFEQCVN